MDILRFFRAGIKKTGKKIIDSIIKLLPIYYKRLDRLPLWNWFEIKKGNYTSLYKIGSIKIIPNFFVTLVMELFFQFDNLDLTLLRKKADYAFINSNALRTGDKSLQFQADSLKKEIEDKESKSGNNVTLNEFVDYIELTFNCVGTIDPYKISTSRAFSLYNKASKKNENNSKR